MVDVLIFYERLEREYENDTLLRLELERRGYKVRIYNTIYADFYRSLFTKSRITVVHTIRNNRNVQLYTRCFFGKPKAMVDLQYEQVFTKNRLDSGAETPTGKARNTYHVCWGDEAADRLRNAGIPEKYIWNIGAIQFDLLRPELKEYYRTRESLAEEYGLDSGKRWVLFNGNFPYLEYTKEQLLSEIKKSPTVEQRFRDMLETQKELVRWFEALLIFSKNIEFIYRPHPTEKPSSNIRLLDEKYNHFHIIGDYSVKQWIVVSDTVNVWDSTSVMEGYYADKACNICWPFEPGDSQKIELFKNCRPVRSAEEFISENLDKDKVSGDVLDLNLVHRFYGKKRDTPVYIALADKIEELLKTPDLKEDYKVKMNRQYIKYDISYCIGSFYADLVQYLNFRLSNLIPRRKKRYRKYEDMISKCFRKNLKSRYDDRLAAALRKEE